MVSNISYRLIAFADYSNIRYDNDTAALLTSKFSEDQYNFSQILDPNAMGQLIPGFALVPGININSPIITVFPGKIDIRVGSNRKEGFSTDEQITAGNILCDYFKRFSNCFGDKLQDSNRLALITEYVYFEIGNTEKGAFRDKFINAPACYDGKKTDEMVVKIFGKDRKTFNGRDEDINFITTVDRWFPGGGIGMTASVDGYRVELDLNTSPENKKNRFEASAIPEFVEQMQKLKAEVIKEIFDDCE